MAAEQILTGIAAAPGVAIGATRCYRPALERAGADGMPQAQLAAVERLDRAIAAADAAIAAIEARLQAAGKRDEARIFAAHRMLLADPTLRDRAVELMSEQGRGPAAAIMAAGEEQAVELLALDDPYLSARAADVRDVVGQVQRILTGAWTLGELLDHPAIVIAHDLGPSDLMSVPRELLLGFALAGGGQTAHSIILAQSLGIPAVIGLGAGLLDQVADGTTVAIDGAAGQLVVAPAAATLERLRAGAAAETARLAEWRAQRDLPSVTRDGKPIALFANASTVAEAQVAREWGAEGIGLLRTEVLFLERPTLPDEDEQLALYNGVAAALPGRPVIVRTLDVGGDKHLPAFPLPREENPFLGWRGIRIGLSQPELLLPQLRALLRAGATDDIRIMLPMIATVAEVRRVRELLREAQAGLAAAGLPYAGRPQLGIMIEIPAAAVAADGLAREADFFSIGTNDLIQYTMACDRGNPRVADLYQPLEPAVLRLIAAAADAAHRHGRHIGVCGTMASEPAYTALLIGLGIDELSCTPPAIPLVRAAVRATDAGAARELARAVLAAPGLEEVRALLSAGQDSTAETQRAQRTSSGEPATARRELE